MFVAPKELREVARLLKELRALAQGFLDELPGDDDDDDPERMAA